MIRTLARVAASTFQTSALLLKFLTFRVVDVFCMLFNVIAVCTVIRIPAIYFSVRRKLHDSSGNDPRRFPYWINLWYFLGIFQIGIFIVDIPFVLMSLPLMVFFWRAVLLLREHGPIKFERENSQYREMNAWGYTGWRLRKLVWKHFCLLCTDFFFIPFSISLTLSWRSSRFRRLLREQYRSADELTWKKMIVKEFLILCNEIICFPIITFLLMSWRSRRVRKKILWPNQSRDSDAEMSDLEVLCKLTENDRLGEVFFHEWYVVISESFYFSIDLATLPVLSTLLLSWRCRVTWLIFKPWYINNLAVNPPGITLPTYNENKTRAKIWGQFFNVVIDLFFIPPMMFVLFSWRVVAFCRSVIAIYSHESNTPNSAEIRLDKKFQKLGEGIIQHFVGILTDIICILQFLVILMLSIVFPWRLYIVTSSVWHQFRSGTLTEQSVKSSVSSESLSAIGDIPTSLAGLIILLTVWRVPFLLSDFVKVRNNESSERKSYLVTSCIFQQLSFLVVDILVSPFFVITLISIWRLKNFVKEVQDSKQPLEATHWQWFMVSYDGYIVRKAAVTHALSFIFIDLPCFGLFLVNIVIPLRLPAIASSLFNCGNFLTEYPIVIITETLNLLVDLVYICFGSVLFLARPVAMFVHLFEDERHRKARELKETIGTVWHILNKSQKCVQDLEDMVNILVKASSTVDGNLCKFLLSKIVVDFSADMEQLKVKLVEKCVDDRFIHLISKYLFLYDKQGYFMYRRFLVEKIHLKRPSYYARLLNLDMFHSEYTGYSEQLKKTEDEILKFDVENPPLWSKSVGFMLRTRKENHAVIIKTVTTGYFASFSMVCLNVIFIYRAVPLLVQIINEPYLIRKKARRNLEQYWMDLKCLVQILLVIVSIYRCPDLISDLITDIFYKKSISAVRSTAAAYPPKVKDDILKCLSALFRWRFVAYLISSILFFCFIPLSALFNVGKAFSSDSRKVIGGVILVYLCIIAIPVGIIFDVDDNMILLQHQLFEYLCGVSTVLILFLGVLTKKPHHLPPVDYVRFNWGLIHVIIHEVCQLGQILGLLFRLSLAIDPDRWYQSIFRTFLFEGNDPESNLAVFNKYFYCWFFISSAPVILEGVLKYVPEGKFSNSNFSWQFLLSLLGSVSFPVIPYLGSTYLFSKTSEGVLIWQGEPYVAAKCLMFLVWYLLTSVNFYCRYFNSTNPMFDLHFSPLYNSTINMMKLALILTTVLLDLAVITKIVILLIMIILMIAVTVFYSQIISRISTLADQHPCNSNLLKSWRLSILLSTFIIISISLLYELFPSMPASTLSISIPLVLVVMIIFMVAKIMRYTSNSTNEESRETFISLVKEIEESMREKEKDTLNWRSTRSGWLNLLRAVRLANEQDKQAEQTNEELFEEGEIVAALTESAPPTYDQVDGDKDLPSYHSVNTFHPPADYNPGTNFIPDMDYLTSPVGIWHPYSASHLVNELSYMSGHCDLTQTITDKKCTGSNVLLLLEKHIHYTALTRTCVQKLVVWRALVSRADWAGLVKYATMLKRALTCQYDTPTQTGIVKDLMEEDFLKPLADDSFFPEFVENANLCEVKLRVHRVGREALLAILPDKISQLFAMLISENFPMIHKIQEDTSSNIHKVTCEFFKAININIQSVPGEGFKMAAGASIQIPKTLVFEKLSEECIKFSSPYPLASKSFLSASITMFKTFDIDGIVRIGISDDCGKTAELEKAIQTLTDLSWN